jgi:hypothetical protein
MANGMVEACWLWQLLQELHTSLMKSTLIYCDNISAIDLSMNPIQHQCKACRDRTPLCVAIGDVRVLHVSTTSKSADIFTKGLPTSVFLEFWSSLNIHSG